MRNSSELRFVIDFEVTDLEVFKSAVRDAVEVRAAEPEGPATQQEPAAEAQNRPGRAERGKENRLKPFVDHGDHDLVEGEKRGEQHKGYRAERVDPVFPWHFAACFGDPDLSGRVRSMRAFPEAQVNWAGPAPIPGTKTAVATTGTERAKGHADAAIAGEANDSVSGL